jgi:hypothetical protein
MTDFLFLGTLALTAIILSDVRQALPWDAPTVVFGQARQ